MPAHRAGANGKRAAMVLIKIALVGVAVIALLGVAKQQKWYDSAHITGHCTVIPTPSGKTGQSWACRQGILTGFPNLPEDRCETDGYLGERQVWRCAIPLDSVPGY